MTISDLVERLYLEIKADCPHDQTMGKLEKIVDQKTMPIRRALLEMLTRDAVAEAGMGCPYCGEKLKVIEHGRERTVTSTVGLIRFGRSYGYCPRCQRRVFPADVALGLHTHARSSPRIQEICAVTALRAPVGQAEEDVRRISGLSIPASTLYREALRQGERALEIRDRDCKLAEEPHGAASLAAKAAQVPPHSTVVIEIDAWNIRERDHWGQTQQLRDAGEEPGRWHWVYTGTVFRLDQRGTTENNRSFLADRGYVATRAGLDSFRLQLYAEALQRGIRQAETVLVLGDGAAWIWNLADKQFGKARQRLDLYHAKQHLWDLAAELHGKNTPEAEEWVRPHLRAIERDGGVLEVIASLEELKAKLDGLLDEKRKEAVAREAGYLDNHKDRMDYQQAKALKQPCGSGAIESTCSQYQRRFKLTGQFWSLEGDETFLALATLYRNERWHLLFPHDRPSDATVRSS